MPVVPRQHHGLRDLPPVCAANLLARRISKEVLSKKNLTVEDAEKALIIRALKECEGNRQGRRENRHEPPHLAPQAAHLHLHDL